MSNLKYSVKNDLFAGITVAIVALPLALAFGVQSGLGAVTGIYGAILLGFFASIVGGTPCQVSGPTGPMTVISAVVVATAIENFGSIDAGLPYILTIFFLSGVFQILFGLSGIGKNIKYVPYPVISGFLTGIGIIIILLQICPLLGHESPKKIINIFFLIHEPLNNINWYATGLTLSTVMVIYIAPKFTKAIPSTLISFVLFTTLATLLDLPVPKIGNIPSGLPVLQLGTLLNVDLSDIYVICVAAITIAALGSIDSLLTSVIVDNMLKVKHDSNRELIGQGIGNMAAALFSGIPGAGATMRTVTNIKAGGRSKLSGMTHSIILLLILMGASNYAALIPLSVLAGILLSVGISIIDYKGLKHLNKIPKTDAFILIIVVFMTVFVDLLQAVGTGLILSTVFFMKKSEDLNELSSKIGLLENFTEELPWADEQNLPIDIRKQVYIKHISGPLFFGFTDKFTLMARATPLVNYVIIRMNRVPYIDQSGLYALEDAIMYLKQKNITVLVVALQKQPFDMMSNIHLIPELLDPKFIFETFDESIKYIAQETNFKR